jgi:hypothetical protein
MAENSPRFGYERKPGTVQRIARDIGRPFDGASVAA